MEDPSVERNDVYPQSSISPKVFVLSITGAMILSVALTVAVIYLVWGRSEVQEGSVKENNTNEELSNLSPTPISVENVVFESDVCGIAFEYPADWSITLDQEEERACVYKVSDQPESLNGVLIESLPTWEDIIKEYQDTYSEDASNKLEKITFLAEDAYHITLNSSEEFQLTVPVEYIFMKRQNAYFRISYAQVQEEVPYQKMTEIIQSIRFTQTLDFYDQPFDSISPFDIQKVLDKSQDTNVKSDMFMLQNALEQHYADTFRYPYALSELNGKYLRIDTRIEDGISYTSDGKTYQLKTVLSDGSEYVLTSEDN